MLIADNKHSTIFYGMHPCIAALNNKKRTCLTLFLTEELHYRDKDKYNKLLNLNPKTKLVICQRSDFDKFFGKDVPHQNIAVSVANLPNLELKDIISDSTTHKNILILDQITDPHNIGAIARTAAAFNAKAIIIQDKNSPKETAVMAKSACGALEHISFIRVKNISRTISELKKNNFWIYAFDDSADFELNKEQLIKRSSQGANNALIFGAEGKGIRDLVSSSADFIVSIPTSNAMKSLNVSNSVAIGLFYFNM